MLVHTDYLWFNTKKVPLNDPAVRQAISFGINRQQLSVDGESGNEPSVTSTAGMDSTWGSYAPSSLAGNLPATGDSAKVSQILTADGYKKVGGFWEKKGQKITFQIEVPVQYSDYYADAQLLVSQLKKLGFNPAVKGDPGNNGGNVWAHNLEYGNFSTAIH